MPRSRYRIYDDTYPHFLTCSTVEWIPLFEEQAVVDIVLGSLRFLGQEGRMAVHAYVLMPDHLHFIGSGAGLSREVACFKAFTARRIVEHVRNRNPSFLGVLEVAKRRHKRDRAHQVWDEGSYPKAILTEEIFRQKVDYIHANPVRRGLTEHPADWLWSSFGDFGGEPGPVPIAPIVW